MWHKLETQILVIGHCDAYYLDQYMSFDGH